MLDIFLTSPGKLWISDKAFVLFSLAGNYNTPKGKNNASVVASELDATELEIAKGLLAKCISELTEICF